VEHKANSSDDRPLRLVTAIASGDSGLIAIAKSLLQAAGIPYVTCGEGVQDLFGWGRIVGTYNFVTGPIELRVSSDDADDAKTLLKDLIAGDGKDHDRRR
jgi:hypothetical protein